MEYTIDGDAVTSLGHGDPGITWGEDTHKIDGLYKVAQYPNLVFAGVNGKIKYADFSKAPQSSASVYNVDTSLSLTAGNPVFMRDYRGMLYYCNGVEDFGRVGIGQLYSSLATTPATSFDILADSGATYSWTASGSGTNEYFVRLTAGTANPHIGTPVSVLINNVTATQGSLGSLAVTTWGYGDNDSLGYSTVYVRLTDGTDPDSKTTGWVQAELRTLFLNPAEGYRFTDGVDKVYIEGDEIDYTDELDGSSTDRLMGVTNVTASHAAGAYVTQYNAITAPSTGSAKCTTMAIFRDTLWIAGMANEPGVLRYGKTIGSVGALLTGDMHNFSDNYNYIIGDGGPITALQATEDRLYVFLKDKVHYIGTVIASTGTQVFDRSKLFTGVYGCPNAYCVTEMEDVVIFFTGKRLIRIGYDPNGQTLIPDEKFDREILPLLQDADEDQTNARLVYNPTTKELRLKYISGGIAKVIKYHKQLDKYSAHADEDASCYVVHRRNTYFGDVADDVVWKIGMTIDSEGDNTQHRYKTGRWDGKSKNLKLFKKGVIRGKKNRGSALYVLTKIDDKNFGEVRLIPESAMDYSVTPTSLGDVVTGGDTVGVGDETTNLFPYTYRFLLGKRGKDFSAALSSDESGAVWTVRDIEVEWDENEFEPRTNY